MRPFLAHLKMELTLAFRKGETVLLTLGIPVLFLVFFSEVHVVAVPVAHRVAFSFPGIVALSTMSSAMVSLSISTGFERSYGVLQRLQVTPLGTSRLLLAKICATLVVELVQVAVLLGVAELEGYALPSGTTLTRAVTESVGLVVLATAAFGGIGLTLAGRLKGEVNLAASNGLYLVLLLVSGMVVPASTLGEVGHLARWLPSGALAEGLHACCTFGRPVSTTTWLILAAWAVAAPTLATFTFEFAP